VAPEGGKLAREGEGHVHQRASQRCGGGNPQNTKSGEETAVAINNAGFAVFAGFARFLKVAGFTGFASAGKGIA
jgi:hypothetical protein